ncbi:hypothetical protein KY329_02865 [Candidatus Woesearchaeota archaeon]|nr:hypothetical protein [Candidatus Woesearchaeota archaeon]
MKLIAFILCLAIVSLPALAWYDSTYEKISERVSYTESEQGHSSSSGYRHAAAYDDYSRTRYFDYAYDLERETVNQGWDYSYRRPYVSSWGSWRPCNWNSKYISFGC